MNALWNLILFSSAEPPYLNCNVYVLALSRTGNYIDVCCYRTGSPRQNGKESSELAHKTVLGSDCRSDFAGSPSFPCKGKTKRTHRFSHKTFREPQKRARVKHLKPTIGYDFIGINGADSNVSSRHNANFVHTCFVSSNADSVIY